MFGLFQRPKLAASFAATEAVSNEFTREIELAGRLELRNDGSDADLSSIEMMIIAGFRRIPLDVPGPWKVFRLARAMPARRPAVEAYLDSPLAPRRESSS
jgi:hypothetical protein